MNPIKKIEGYKPQLTKQRIKELAEETLGARDRPASKKKRWVRLDPMNRPAKQHRNQPLKRGSDGRFIAKYAVEGTETAHKTHKRQSGDKVVAEAKISDTGD